MPSIFTRTVLIPTLLGLVGFLNYETLCSGEQATSGSSHDCNRPCSWPAEPMICNFDFAVEWFSSMSVYCGDCPFNDTDCDADNCIPLNGVQRPIITVNRRLPGPNIQVCEGDIIKVSVSNHLDDQAELTIHWHGMHQVGTPFMDGVPKVTQCPIPHGSSFMYTFNASNPGTHYWHAHSGTQRSDGCAGTLTVRQAPQRDLHYGDYDIDDEAHTLLLQDWFDSLTLTRFIGHFLVKLTNAPDAILINGHGRRAQFRLNASDPPAYTRREVLHVQQGMRHRFRLISNIITHCPLKVSVDNHTLVVISTDGHDVRATEVDVVTVFAGERYDVILDANKPPGNYWLRVQGLGDCESSFELALIKYNGIAEDTPPSLPGHYTPLDEGVILNPYNEMDLSSPFRIPVHGLRSLVEDTEDVLTSDVTRYYLTFDVNNVTKYNVDGHMTADDMNMHSAGITKRSSTENITGTATGRGRRLTTAQINHVSFKIPNTNVLTQFDEVDKSIICDVSNIDPSCKTSYCECTQVLTASLGENIELVLVDEGFQFDQSHPMHMHGYSYRVIAQARKGTSLSVEEVKEMDAKGLIERNLVDPPLKDTVAVPDGGYTIIRFRASNPGWWLFHCHLEFHVMLGMTLVIRVGDQEDLPPTPDDFPTCNDWPPRHAGNETSDTGGSHVTSGTGMLSLIAWMFLIVSASIL